MSGRIFEIALFGNPAYNRGRWMKPIRSRKSVRGESVRSSAEVGRDNRGRRSVSARSPWELVGESARRFDGEGEFYIL